MHRLGQRDPIVHCAETDDRADAMWAPVPGIVETEFLPGEDQVGVQLTCKSGKLPYIKGIMPGSYAERRQIAVGSRIYGISLILQGRQGQDAREDAWPQRRAARVQDL